MNRSRYARPERQPTSRSRSVTLGAHPGRRCGSGPKASSRRNGSGAASRRCSTSVSLVTGLDSKPEALVYDASGSPLKGIHPASRYVPVVSAAAGGEQVRFLVEAAANPDVLAQGFVPTEVGDRLTAADTPLFHLRRADSRSATTTCGGSRRTCRSCRSSCMRCRRTTRADTKSFAPWSGHWTAWIRTTSPRRRVRLGP